MVFNLSRIVRLTSIVGKRSLYIGRKLGPRSISSRVSPYIIDFINHPAISYDHIQHACKVLAETELLTGVIRIVSILISIRKFIPK